LQSGEGVKGYEADKVARDVIEKGGFGPYFTHRTGHNIYQTLHGPGVHLDGFETMDDRDLIPNTCFTIEPGIYLPGDMGVRVEYDVVIDASGQLEITSGIQTHIRTMF
jgi:Xaa-Pro aminopeptidase